MKRFLLICLTAAMLLGLVACGGADSGDTLTLSFLRLGNDEAERTFWQEVIAEYEAANEGVKIAYDEAAIGDAMDTKLTNLFTGNAGPDIIGHGILSIASRVEAGHYVPLTQQYEKWEGKDDIFPQLVDLGTYKGEIYGIAYSPAPYVFAYRIDMLKEAGFDRPPQTWEELAEYARALTVTENGRITRAGFAFPTAAGNLVEYDVFAYGNGGGFVGENSEPTLNTPENLEALTFLADLINEVSIPYNSNETNPFMTGNAAMTLIDNIKLSPMFAMEEYKDKIGIALPPSNEGKRQMTFSGSRLLFIGKDCKNQKVAFDFIEFAVSKAVVQKRAEDLNVPVVLSSLHEEFSKADPYNGVRADCVANGIGMPIVTWSSIFQRVRNELVQRVLNGEDPAAVLADAQQKIELEIQNAQ
jgi:ABC-type glycerol-3-phosphate transport system substrate-binding protein